jgi:hypothetical protein
MLRGRAGGRHSAQSPPELGSRSCKALAGRTNVFTRCHSRGFSSFSAVMARCGQTVQAGSPCRRAGAGARHSAHGPPQLGSRCSQALVGRPNMFTRCHSRGFSSFSAVMARAGQTVKAGWSCCSCCAGGRHSVPGPSQLGSWSCKALAGRTNVLTRCHSRGFSSFSAVMARAGQTVNAGSSCRRARAGGRQP